MTDTPRVLTPEEVAGLRQYLKARQQVHGFATLAREDVYQLLWLCDTINALRADLESTNTLLGGRMDEVEKLQDERDALRVEARDLEHYFESLRSPLLWYFGTTDPELLVEQWKEQMGDMDTARSPAVATRAVPSETPNG